MGQREEPAPSALGIDQVQRNAVGHQVHHFAVTQLFATSSPSKGAAACAELIRFGWVQTSPKLLPRKFCALPEGEAFWRRRLGVAEGDQVGKSVLLP